MGEDHETGGNYHKYPTIIKWELIKSFKHNGVRDGILNHAQVARRMVSGGIHLTRGAFLPTTIIKEFSASEEDFFIGAVNWNFLFTATTQQLNEEQRKVYEGYYRSFEKFFSGLKLLDFSSYF